MLTSSDQTHYHDDGGGGGGSFEGMGWTGTMTGGMQMRRSGGVSPEVRYLWIRCSTYLSATA